MDPKRGAMILVGLAFVIAVIGIAAYSLFSNIVLDSWFTVLKPKEYSGTEVNLVQTYRHNGNTLTVSERPMTQVKGDRSRGVTRFLVVEFNGQRLTSGELPIIPSEQSALKVHYLIQPVVSTEEMTSVEAALLQEQSEQQAPSPSYQSQRSRNSSAYLFATTPDFDEVKFNNLVACWKANEASIKKCLEKSDFMPQGGGYPVPFDITSVKGLVLGNPPIIREYISGMPGRFYEGSVETLVMHPSGRWKITGTVGPVAAPLEAGIVQIREGEPYLWAVFLPSLEGPDATGVALADHLKSFVDGSGVRLTSVYRVDPFKLIQPTVEEELRAQARKLGIKPVPAPPAGLEGAVPATATVPGATPVPGTLPNGIEALPGFDPTQPEFQTEDPSGLPPESEMRQNTGGLPIPY